MRSDLSGNATTPFDWGYIGGGQLSLALLSDFFGSDVKAKAMAVDRSAGVSHPVSATTVRSTNDSAA